MSVMSSCTLDCWTLLCNSRVMLFTQQHAVSYLECSALEMDYIMGHFCNQNALFENKITDNKKLDLIY